MGICVEPISFLESKYFGIKWHCRCKEGILWSSDRMVWFVYAFFFFKFFFLLCAGGGGASIQNASQSFHGGFSPKGSVFVILISTHPEEAISCFHEAHLDKPATRLECHHDDPLAPILAQVAPDMIEKGTDLFPDPCPFQSFSRDQIFFDSFQRSPCTPPPRKQ